MTLLCQIQWFQDGWVVLAQVCRDPKPYLVDYFTILLSTLDAKFFLQ
jgi:hypothetical protein